MLNQRPSLESLIPDGWQMEPMPSGIRLVAPKRDQIVSFLNDWKYEVQGAATHLAQFGMSVWIGSTSGKDVVIRPCSMVQPSFSVSPAGGGSSSPKFSAVDLEYYPGIQGALETMFADPEGKWVLVRIDLATRQDHTQILMSSTCSDLVKEKTTDEAVQARRKRKNYWHPESLIELNRKIREHEKGQSFEMEAVLCSPESKKYWRKMGYLYRTVEVTDRYIYQLGKNLGVEDLDYVPTDEVLAHMR